MIAPAQQKQAEPPENRPVAQLLLSLLPNGQVEVVKRGGREDVARLMAACSRRAA